MPVVSGTITALAALSAALTLIHGNGTHSGQEFRPGPRIATAPLFKRESPADPTALPSASLEYGQQVHSSQNQTPHTPTRVHNTTSVSTSMINSPPIPRATHRWAPTILPAGMPVPPPTTSRPIFGESVIGHTALPVFTIDLDLPPRERYTALVPRFNATVWRFWREFFARDAVLCKALYALTKLRGLEPTEMHAEIEGMAEASRLPLQFVQGIQMLYELQTLMIPVVNFSSNDGNIGKAYPDSGTNFGGDLKSQLNYSAVDMAPIPSQFAALGRLPFRGPGCTGIIAVADDGVVYHARNLDFAPRRIMQDLVYTGIFTRNGTELFRAQMIAGYASIITAMRRGPNGYALQRNTRYPDHFGGNAEMFRHLLNGRILNGWRLRKILERESEFEAAAAAVAAAPFVSTEYSIISGVRKGVIFSKAPDRVAHVQNLSASSAEQRGRYIIMTNFDFFYHDVREYFDPTAGTLFRPRRLVAESLLSASPRLSSHALLDVISADGVVADTVFQAIISVELDMWNASQPLYA